MIIEGATREIFHTAEQIRAMWPNNRVLIFAPGTTINTYSEKEMGKIGWVRGRPGSIALRDFPCQDPECESTFTSEGRARQHFELAHTEAGRERMAKMQAARKK